MNKRQKITIRYATKNDLQEIKDLILYLMKIEKTQDIERETKLIIEERVKPTFQKSSLNKTFLAILDDKIVGLIIFEIKHKRIGSIAYIIIASKYQKKGIGSMLLQYADQYAKELNLEQIQVLVSKNNKETQQFYKKQKFSLFCYLFRKKI